MEAFLIHGPGSHGDLIDRFFAGHFKSWSEARHWPTFSITNHHPDNSKTKFSSRAYDVTSFLSYALNNRLSLLTHGRQLQIDLLLRYYDRLCASRFTGPQRLLAWSQASLKSLQRNKELGGVSILEHPMPHVNQWMKVNQSFYDNPEVKIKPGYSRFSSSMVKRMRSEYAEPNFINVHSSFAKDTFVSNGIDPSRILLTPLGIDPASFPHHRDRRQSASRLRITYVGRLELVKGLHLLAPLIRESKTSDIEWKLAGRVLPEVKPFLRDLDHVVLGSLDKKGISKLLGNTDVLIFPSLNDAFGLVIIEAMLHGVPVIASRFSAGPDIISHMEDGYLINPVSIETLSQGIAWALENKGRLAEIGENARRKVRGNYLVEHYFARFATNLQKAGFLTNISAN